MMRSADAGAGLQPSRGRGAWERALALALAVAVAGFAGCGGDPKPPPAVDAAVGPPWWQPKVGEAKNWDIQLSAPIDVSAPRVMYDLDLWALVPSKTTIDYGDGDPVTVDQGSLAGTIAQLHARTPSTIVICHVETGMLEMNRPDARKFPGYMSDPKQIPDNPADPAPGAVTGNPAPGSVIGWSLGGKCGGVVSKRFLDVSEASRATWASIMWKRFDLARSIGCDGVEPAHNSVISYASGFTIASEQSYSWYGDVAKAGHDRGLSTGMQGADYLDGQVDTGTDKFDWLMVERCGESEMCDREQPFIAVGKPVFAIEYDQDSGDCSADPPVAPKPQLATAVCPNQLPVSIADGLFKDVALTKNVRVQCEP